MVWKRIKITDKLFLEKIKILESPRAYFWKWNTSTGKVFQDIQLWDKNFNGFWTGNRPEDVYKYYLEDPERRGIFALVGNNLKSYSRGKMKNIFIEYEWRDE